MAVIVLSIIFGCVMIFIARRANSRFRAHKRLPMQWLISKSQPLAQTVTWSAPRRVAVALIPCLSIIVLAAFDVAAFSLKPRPGQEGMKIPALFILGVIFLGAQLLHLRLIAKTLDGQGMP